MFATRDRTDSWLNELNAEQRTAATHAGGALLVLAGAGTGKTTTLAARVAWLLADGVAPERILLLTFTRRAAREMLQRARTLAARAGAPATKRVLGGTFHSVANRLVRMHASALGLSAGFGVLDAGDAADVLDMLREEHGQAGARRRFPRKATLLDIYSRTVNSQRQLSDVLSEHFPWCEEHRDPIAAIFTAYTKRKRTLGVLDLDDLLLYWRALVQDGAVGRQLAEGFDHVLVDEYQDVNDLQVAIIRGMRPDGDGVTAVGDDFQAIYGFRAASAEHILAFPEHFPGTTTVTLERNYRSSQPVLDVANGVSEQVERGFHKRLRAARDGGERPELVFCRDEAQQAAEVCDRILAAREQAIDLRDQAVLFRTSHDSDLLELELSRRDIPFVKYGGLRYLEAAHVKDFVALLRLADNAADELSWFRVLQLLDGVGPVRARGVLEALRPAPGMAPEAERWSSIDLPLPPESRALGATLASTLVGTRSERPGVRAERLRDALAPLISAHYPDGPLRLEDLEQLVGAAAEASDLGHFVAELVIDPPRSSADIAQPPHLDEDYLVLSTAHSAKGLEWSAVHVIAAYDGNFPACMSAGSRESIDEERRLFYVALTRPRRSLHVYVPVRYYHRPKGGDDAHGYGKASRFLTPEVQSLCRVTRTHEPPDGPHSPAPPGPPRITVSVDSLFA